MSKIAYISKNFKPSSTLIIQQANEIIDEYMDDGYRLTLRQLYYQFVSRGFIPNKQKEYKRLGSIVGDARLAGLTDWAAIEDRTRSLRGHTHWRDPGHIIGAVKSNFRLNHWAGQQYHVEVWIEKEALTGVIAGICGELDVAYFACKGYVSLSEMWRAAQRFEAVPLKSPAETVPIKIIHLGDHDPSGMDMTRDIEDRQDVFGVFDIEVKRIALNMDQIKKYNPPPNPAKVTDSRCNGYVAMYGHESWELDALEPRVLRNLIKDTVLMYRDEEIYNQVLNQEKKYINVLDKVEKNWKQL
ncbi:hypothetical protein LCGC14_0944750 [marine sediment metagenome]|uniref:Uncharacterized protein n=1 Tax=marine sediment metagenome TaxID=412755 RepID=A0A0F9NJ22_9ZZZZ|nr:hypothetical protein [Desulfobacterales bacterium]